LKAFSFAMINSLLRRSPGFTFAAIATFGLAIGSTTAVFSHVRATILAPLPYPDPDRLVSVWPSGGSLARSAMAVHMYDAVGELHDTFAAVAAIGGQSENLTGTGEPERVRVVRATQSFQAVTGIRMAEGRWLVPEEDLPGRNAVAVLSHGFWMRRFGGDPSIVGRRVTLNAVPHLVVGIVEPRSPYPPRADIWVPIAFTAEQRSLANRGSEYLDVVARLRPGVTPQQASGSLDALGQRLRTLYGISVKWTLRSAMLDDDLRGNLRPIVISVFSAVLLVFIAACANIANLLLARAGERRREFAVRLAIGASPWQIRKQALGEAGTLAGLGGIAGILVAAWLSPLLWRLAARAGVALAEARIDGVVLIFGFAVTIASALLAGALPSWHLARVPLNELLGQSGRGSSGTRMKPALLVAEIAVAFVVVVSAALLAKSLIRVSSIDPGFGVDDRLTMSLTLPAARYASRPQREAFYARLFEELRGLPGVRAVGGVSELPLSTQRNMASFDVEHRVVAPGETGPHADMRSATPGYFETMGIRFLRGRRFEERDGPESTQVALIDDTVARRVFGAEDPIGRRVALGIDPDGVWREIVGIVGSAHHDSLEATVRGTVYVPLAQRPTRSIFAIVHASGEPLAVVPRVRDVLRHLDADLPLYDIATLRDRLDDSVGRRTITAAVVGTYGAVAVLIALTGVYGVIAYAVAQRTREVGVRMALGAQREQVLWLFVRTSGLIALTGVVLGASIALPLTRAGSMLLFNVNPHDPLTYLSVGAGIVLLTAGISAMSARHATRIDPLAALRQ
jgi:predicted permease